MYDKVLLVARALGQVLGQQTKFKEFSVSQLKNVKTLSRS